MPDEPKVYKIDVEPANYNAIGGTVESEPPKESVTVKTPEVPVLTPEEQEKLEARRKVFRKLYEDIAELDTYEAEVKLIQISSEIEASWSFHQSKVNVGDVESVDMNGNKLPMTPLRELVKDTSVSEALAYFVALGNAIKAHRYQETKDIKVKDLGIKLL